MVLVICIFAVPNQIIINLEKAAKIYNRNDRYNTLFSVYLERVFN